MPFRRIVACLFALGVLAVSAAACAAPAAISSIGDARMRPLMDAWLRDYQARTPGISAGTWIHDSDAAVFGALMFENADMAPLARLPLPSEIAPYAHQFSGDMMKAPLLVQVAGTREHPAYIAVNKRPGSPLPARVSAFLSYTLSAEGQAVVASNGTFTPLAASSLAAEREKLDGFLATLDPALPHYTARQGVSGTINSVGSDGMKTLMDRWMRLFRAHQPGVHKGERWEHLGTLNGFHALIRDDTDLAPMGRELWPSERAAYQSGRGENAPLEIRVARGGFNTPQRTTAQAIFVHPSNPLAALSVPQLRAILGADKTATSWGQLGLDGAWATRPITVYTPPAAAPNSMSMQINVLGGGAWRSGVRTGSIADTATAIAADPSAIGFGGLEEGGPGLKVLALSATDGGRAILPSYASVSGGSYPLARYMYIRLNRRPGQPIDAPVREFLRFILSREAQESILYSGYFPLTATEVRQELEKLD